MIINSKQFPKVFYGLHFCEGVAEYQDNSGSPYRIFLNEETLRKMDTTFPGKPIYVEHVDKVNLEKIQTEADGYVVESFFNKTDGAHWVKFIAVSDEAIKAIEEKKWKLSNAYVPKAFGNSGSWHGVDYAKEILDAEFEHLAIVPNPRYAESIILTPEEFKKYNTNKNLELEKVSNSKGVFSMFNFFKKTKVEAGDLADTSVILPKTKKEVTIGQLINEADVEPKEEIAEEKKDAVEPKEEVKEEVMADPKHMVNVGEEKMTVEELLKKHDCMKQELEEIKKPKEEVKEEVKEEKKDGEDPVEHEKALEKIEELEKHEEESIAEAKKNHFETLKNAELSINTKNQVLELSCDLVSRGKKLFGSN